MHNLLKTRRLIWFVSSKKNKMQGDLQGVAIFMYANVHIQKKPPSTSENAAEHG